VTVFGYARCSTDGQDLSGQIEALRSAGCERVYHEKVSGARIDRRELDRLIRRLRPGDQVMVTRLDRLARSTRDLLNVLEGDR
jgi:DNA invertase Pin-like site-specific DNA recombinase